MSGKPRKIVAVPANETGRVRLFHIGEPISVEGLRTVMQASNLDPQHVDLFDPAELDEGALYRLMVEGMGIDPGTIDRSVIDGLTGTVAVIRSKAFGGKGQSLQLMPPIRFIGEYREPVNSVQAGPIKSQSTKGTISGGGAKSDKAMSGKIALVTLVLLFLLVIVMVIIGG